MRLLVSAFSSDLPHVISGPPTGRKCATQLVNNCRGARRVGIREGGQLNKGFDCGESSEFHENSNESRGLVER